MKSPFALQKTLSLLSLLSAGTLAPTVVCAEPITVSTEEDLRKNLSDSAVANTTINVDAAITVETFDTGTSAANPISILAQKVTLTGGDSAKISPQHYATTSVPLETNLSLFTLSANEVFLNTLTLSVSEPLSDENETGRFFLLNNAATLNLGEKVTLSGGSLYADSTTPYGARGGAILSAHILDEISIGAGTNQFSGNIVRDKSSADAENSGAFGGAIYASGLVSVDELASLTFSQNSVSSDANDASGGAIFISNAKLESTGPSSSVTYPDSVTDTTGTQKYGLQVAGTVNFSSNKATGENASGGAIFVSGGYFDATGTATISFEKNSATNNTGAAEGSSLAGGALAIGDSGRATFSENTTLTFSENSLTGTNGVKTKAAGGALAVMDADFSFAGTGTLTFEKNSVSGYSGSTLSGGAAYFYGSEETIKNSDGTTTVGNTTNITLAGTVSFVSNKVEALSENNDSTASGGAIYVSGAKIDGSNLSSLNFQSNQATASAGAVSGGAIAIEGESADVSLVATEEIVFSTNSATATKASDEGAALGGAIFQSAGTLSLGTTSFSENFAKAETKSPTAFGGAIYLSGGDQTFLSTAEFSNNYATATGTDTAAGAGTALGGAIYISGGTQTFCGEVNFTNNSACADTTTGGLASGGAIYQASTAGKISFANACTFSGNKLTTDSTDSGGVSGGAIYSAGEIFIGGEGEFQSNSAEAEMARGGAIYLSGGSLTANLISASKNSVSGSSSALGGAIFIDSASTMDVADTLLVEGNSAKAGHSSATTEADTTAQGGAIYTAGTLEGFGFHAEGNSVSAVDLEGTAQGGAIYIAGGNVSITDATFTGNSASAKSGGGTAQGGAIYIAGGNVSLTNVTFTGNAVLSAGTAQGGAIYIAGGNVSLTNATFSGNTASRSGGISEGDAIYINSSRESTLKFSGNTKFDQGDTIYIGSGTETVTIEFSQESGQTAEVSSLITGDKNSSLILKKTGEGTLTIDPGDISVQKLSLNCEGGETTIYGEVSSDIDISVAAGATLYVESARSTGYATLLKGVSSMNIAGDFLASGVAEFVLNSGSTTEISSTGSLGILESTLKINGVGSAISGDGELYFADSSKIEFASAQGETPTLTASKISVRAGGTLTLAGSSGNGGTLTVTDSLTFTDTGSEEIIFSNAAKLSLTKILRTSDNVSVTFSGDGILGDGTTDSSVDFATCYETDGNGNSTGNLLTGTFLVKSDTKILGSVSVGEGVTLSFEPEQTGESENRPKNVTLAGGTLLAINSSEADPFEMETFKVTASESGASSTLGDGSAVQAFKMVASDEKAAVNPAEISGALEITEKTKFLGNVKLLSGATLSGAGSLQGDISGTGTVSLASVDGNISVENGSQITLAEAVSVTGKINVGTEDSYGNARLAISSGANISAGTINNYGRTTVSGDAVFSGTSFYNAGTLVVGENSNLKFDAGSTFENSLKLSDGTTRVGTIDLTAANSSIDFTNASGVELSSGKILIDATTLPANTLLPIFGVPAEQTLSITDASGYDLTNRFAWDDSQNAWIFYGLNGEAFRGTIFGDWQRESVNRTHEFLRAALFRGNSRPLAPEIYGTNKKTSPYMRGYLDKMSRRGADVSAEIEAKNKEESARAEKLNSPLKNVWAQADYASRERKSDGDFVAYDSTIASVLAGFSLPLGKNWEIGAMIFGSTEKYETSDTETSHKITTDSYGLAGYSRYKNEWFDWSAGATGALDFSDSDRGEYSGSFDGARLGAMTEFGATLRVRSSVALRAFAGISLAYSQNDSFDESGNGGNGALSIDSADAFGARTNLGISSAFMVTDALQFGVRLAWLLDLGKDTYSLDAYMPGTRTDYVIDSRENSTSALDAGAYFNWAVADEVEIFGGYTGTFRSGETAHGFTFGVNCFF